MASIRKHINAGDRGSAKSELADLLQDDPRNVAAWALLANLLDDPARRADCYRRILRIDPEHSLAAARLKALNSQNPGPLTHEDPRFT